MAEEAAKAMEPNADLLEWMKRDKCRLLHAVYRPVTLSVAMSEMSDLELTSILLHNNKLSDSYYLKMKHLCTALQQILHPNRQASSHCSIPVHQPCLKKMTHQQNVTAHQNHMMIRFFQLTLHLCHLIDYILLFNAFSSDTQTNYAIYCFMHHRFQLFYQTLQIHKTCNNNSLNCSQLWLANILHVLQIKHS